MLSVTSEASKDFIKSSLLFSSNRTYSPIECKWRLPFSTTSVTSISDPSFSTNNFGWTNVGQNEIHMALGIQEFYFSNQLRVKDIFPLYGKKYLSSTSLGAPYCGDAKSLLPPFKIRSIEVFPL